MNSEQMEEVERLLKYMGDMREMYHMPREGGPLTLAELKRGEAINAEMAVQQTVMEHNGKQDMEPNDYFMYWHKRPTHSRDLPDYAIKTAIAGCYTPDGLRDIVADAWSLPEFPESNYSSQHWNVLFTLAGPFHSTPDGISALRVRSIPTLYRGAVHSRRKGMAWTTDLAVAKKFAERFSGPSFGTGHIWTLDSVPHSRVLARFNCRGESEWVINTKGLTPQRHETIGA